MIEKELIKILISISNKNNSDSDIKKILEDFKNNNDK